MSYTTSTMFSACLNWSLHKVVLTTGAKTNVLYIYHPTASSWKSGFDTQTLQEEKSLQDMVLVLGTMRIHVFQLAEYLCHLRSFWFRNGPPRFFLFFLAPAEDWTFFRRPSLLSGGQVQILEVKSKIARLISSQHMFPTNMDWKDIMSGKGNIHSQIAIENLQWYSKLILKGVNIDIIMASISSI